MKKLLKFMKDKELNTRHVAQDMRMPIGTVYSWLRGKAKPSIRNAYALEKYSKGAVTVYDWL